MARVAGSARPGQRPGLHVGEALHRLEHAFLVAEPGILDAAEGRHLDAITRHFPDIDRANLELVDRVRAIADSKGCTPCQLALAWVLAQGDDELGVAPIPGTKRVKYLEENVGAADVALTYDDLAALDAAVPRGAVVGDRYGDLSSIDS